MNREVLEKPFSPEQIKQRKGNFGKMLDYIEGYAVIQRLNDAFDGSWSFTITHHKILKDSDEVIVLGELKAGGVVKNQFGSSQITRAKESKNIISLSDDLKAAATDCIKKAATLFGVGLHLYNHQTQTDHGSRRNIQSRNNGGNGSNPYRGNGNGNGNGNGQSRTNGKPFQSNYSSAGGNNTTPGGNGSNGNGNGRLTSRQYNYIMRLCDESGRNKPTLDDYCVNAYGVVAQHLSKIDASALINQLMVE